MQQYHDLLRTIKEKGTYKPAARPGMPGTTSLFGYQFRHNLSDGFPLLTTKRIHIKGVITELLWFLRGGTNIQYLIDNGVNIWNEDAYNYYHKIIIESNDVEANSIYRKSDGVYISYNYEEFVEIIKITPKEKLPKYKNYTLGDCGYQYGKVWRSWSNLYQVDEHEFRYNSDGPIDQISNLIDSLRKTPESRRHIVTAVDPAHDSDLALYWCHCLFQFNCRPLSDEQKDQWYFEKEKRSEFEYGSMIDYDDNDVPKYYLDCQLYQRSADVFLGVPYNIASYAFLTHLLAKICNMIPGDFIHTFGDVHIYDNHRDQVEEQLRRTPNPLPKLHLLERHKDHGSLPDHFEKYLNGRYDLDDFLKALTPYDFRIENYNPQPAIKAELSTGLIKSSTK